MKIDLTVDGMAVTAEVDPGETLLPFLRRLGAASVKNGCDNGDCGACAVLVDGRAVNACLFFAAKAAGSEITTAEALAGADGLHPLQTASLDLGAVQCGFCTPGILMTALDLLAYNPDPTEEEVRHWLAANYCRCTGWVKPVEAVLAAASMLREQEAS
ncbi:(2Fe-2S)-binding protein [bacterium]|nr:(2Fe-2S)-binding protein [bacterium]